MQYAPNYTTHAACNVLLTVYLNSRLIRTFDVESPAQSWHEMNMSLAIKP